MNEKNDKNRVKGCLIIGLILTTVLLVVFLIFFGTNKDDNSKIALNGKGVPQFDGTFDGDATAKLSQVVDIKDGVLQNLNFSNYNDERLLKFKIKVDEQYIYESDFIKPKEVLEQDFLNKNNIELGDKEAITEIYSYTTDKELIGQTNVVIKLNDK